MPKLDPGHDPDANALRRALLWVFALPATAHIVINCAVDFASARAYLDAVNTSETDAAAITIQHLLLGCVGRVLHEFPGANARVQGRRIIRLDQVGAAMPINLLGHEGGHARELGIAAITHLERRSLREIASECRASTRTERRGMATNELMRGLFGLADSIPTLALHRGLDLLERVWAQPRIMDALYSRMPITTFLSNAGATLQEEEGLLFRAATLVVPARIALLGTMWATGRLQDEVIAVDGQPVIRPMLPIILMFDHRLIDGVTAGRMLARFAEILRDPLAFFGADGQRRSH